MTSTSPPTLVLAAGGVLWRAAANLPGTVEYAVIHRPKYDDWSLPKGKLDPGETLPTAAVREILEETGFHAVLGRYLQSVTYPVADRREKRVDYWAAEAVDGEFTPNNEVDELRWLPFDKATELLSHDVDRAVLARFLARPPGDRTLLLVRHASAGTRGKFDGPDAERPLDASGWEQAELLTAQTLAFGVDTIYSADRTRCVQTVIPAATALGVRVRLEPSFSEEAFALVPKDARKRIRIIAAKSRTAAICSQSGVIPDLLGWWAKRDGVALAAVSTRKASTWVLTLRGGTLIAADQVAPPTI
ncbi:NUDIX hydrolase [Tomitella biformata]|uniref:NUDIX hydrolase n=1 Tax=Tomitella biformata TaxID=630403 RepID=UPI000462E87E|nr:NUDIX hydrolase [Tomitella biformata]